jgi:hypothetical protein
MWQGATTLSTAWKWSSGTVETGKSQEIWMSAKDRSSAVCVLALALAGLAKAQTPPPPLPPVYETAKPLFPRLVGTFERQHEPAPVPPTMEIEVLDPNVDPRGNPTVLTRTLTGIRGPMAEGRVIVDIPPTVLVHRYYYTGDRSFQARLLPGGPCIIVASHPKTGERQYIPVQLPPGAPRVTYRADRIQYDYGVQAVTVNFCYLFCNHAKVVYRQGVPLTRTIEKVAVDARDATRRLIDRTDIPVCKDKLVNGAKNVALNTVDTTNTVAKRILDPATQLILMLPGAKPLTGTADPSASRDAALRRAEQEAAQSEVFIKTNR